ncbi:MAG: prepilin peptidase [Syntrophus sp. (in: bacteria)]|nr:prepilin peptidase [Syntrophus sp. (in: bacteria)]
MERIVELAVLIFGSIIGSFLNVCIYRIPKGKSIIRPGSSCPACNTPIKFYDNIPIISYILLKGRCRRCNAPISLKYPAVEVITAVLFLFLFNKFGFTMEFPVYMLFVSLLVVISFIDLELQIIPDILSLGGLVAGFLLAFFRPSFTWLDAIYGIFLGGGILFAIAMGYKLIAKREGMGGGDIKLLGMIGAFCGIKGVVFSLMAGSIIGTIVGIPLMLIKRQGTTYAVPFGPFLSLGALLYVFAGEIIIYGFFDFLSRR